MPVDLIKTIHEEDDVPDFSENSDSEDDGKPQKNVVKVKQASKDFITGFQFVSNQKEYLNDTWNDVSKYMKTEANDNLEKKGGI